MDETSDDGLPADIMVNASHQAGVDLDNVRPELHEMIEIGDARACVVDGKSDVESKGPGRTLVRCRNTAYCENDLDRPVMVAESLAMLVS